MFIQTDGDYGLAGLFIKPDRAGDVLRLDERTGRLDQDHHVEVLAEGIQGMVDDVDRLGGVRGQFRGPQPGHFRSPGPRGVGNLLIIGRANDPARFSHQGRGFSRHAARSAHQRDSAQRLQVLGGDPLRAAAPRG